MAGIKVTDLPVLGAAAPDDVMYIVDTSTNTSKQIAVEDIVGGIPDIESGQWNPTPTNLIGSPTVSVVGGNYSRVGSVVTCSLFLDVTMGVAEDACTFSLDLPIASNFSAEKDAFGIIAYNGSPSTNLELWNIKASVSNNNIEIELDASADELNLQYLYAILQYVII
jgi:hypothetical protein